MFGQRVSSRRSSRSRHVTEDRRRARPADRPPDPPPRPLPLYLYLLALIMAQTCAACRYAHKSLSIYVSLTRQVYLGVAKWFVGYARSFGNTILTYNTALRRCYASLRTMLKSSPTC